MTVITHKMENFLTCSSYAILLGLTGHRYQDSSPPRTSLAMYTSNYLLLFSLEFVNWPFVKSPQSLLLRTSADHLLLSVSIQIFNIYLLFAQKNVLFPQLAKTSKKKHALVCRPRLIVKDTHGMLTWILPKWKYSQGHSFVSWQLAT